MTCKHPLEQREILRTAGGADQVYCNACCGIFPVRDRQLAYVANVKRERYEIYIGRGSKWGNPFRIGPDGGRIDVIEKFRNYVLHQPGLMAEAKKELRGLVLGCFCTPLVCHGDIWLSIANDL